MTDTQWLLDLVDEATDPHSWARGWLNSRGPDIARLCVEQHEALTRIADFGAKFPAWEEGSPMDLLVTDAHAALARFEELKP